MTGANYLLESKGQKILIDCGMHQGGNFCEKHNFEPFAYDPKEISAVFVTHAHIDHTGLLPKLIKHGFSGKIYSTAPTRGFAELLLMDSEHILVREAERLKKPTIYTVREIEELMTRWDGIEYHKPIKVGPFEIEFYDAGHILGSCFMVIKAEGKKILFSGDLGNSPAPIIRPRELPPEDIDYCLMESTYGGRTHEKLEERQSILEDVIEDSVKAGGTLMIPAFAMERTQDLLFEINELVENGRMPQIPIFLDSPLAIKLTTVYKKYNQYFNKEAQKLIKGGDAIFNFPGLKMTMTTEESKSINGVKPPKVVIAGSGMSTAGRILHHERRYLSDPKSTLLVVGYQARGSLGRQIQDGAKTVKIMREEVQVRARLRTISGYSAHADEPQLLEWLQPMRQSLKKLFLVQGEEPGISALALAIRDKYAIDAEIPDPAYSIEI